MTNDEQADTPCDVVQYSAFSAKQKRWILALVSFAGWFSSLSSFIYFPAIPALASDLGVGVEQINLTVTAYLVMAGIFPSIVGDTADMFGRRPVFIVTLAIYVAANVGLACQSSYGVLVFLRMMQSVGISGSYSITYGVVSDLFAPSERGGYSGIVSFILNTPPSIGPVIAGLLIQRWGWRSIFWFLSVISPICLIFIILFLPETSRRLVGDGSTRVGRFNRAPFPNLSPSEVRPQLVASTSKEYSCRIPNPLTSLAILRNRGTVTMVVSVGVYYTIYSCLQASLSSIFTETYKVSGLVVGLSYLPFGVACAISAFATGKILDMDYRRVCKKNHITIVSGKDHDLANFPIEEARLRTIQYSLVVCCILIVGYGWSLQFRTHIAVPLILQFLIGLTMQGAFTALSTLLVDVHPDRPSTAQAASNLIRCGLAAGGLALLDVIIRNIGVGWSFLIFGVWGLLCTFLLLLLQYKGLSWRQKKRVGNPESQLINGEDAT